MCHLWRHFIFILQVLLIKLAGYWPSLLFSCLYTQKRTRSISIHLDRPRLVNKGFMTWNKQKKNFFSCGTRRVASNEQDSAILPAWVANHSAGRLDSVILPGHETSRIITSDTVCSRSAFFRRALILKNAKARQAVMPQSLLVFKSPLSTPFLIFY